MFVPTRSLLGPRLTIEEARSPTPVIQVTGLSDRLQIWSVWGGPDFLKADPGGDK